MKGWCSCHQEVRDLMEITHSTGVAMNLLHLSPCRTRASTHNICCRGSRQLLRRWLQLSRDTWSSHAGECTDVYLSILSYKAKYYFLHRSRASFWLINYILIFFFLQSFQFVCFNFQRGEIIERDSCVFQSPAWERLTTCKKPSERALICYRC